MLTRPERAALTNPSSSGSQTRTVTGDYLPPSASRSITLTTAATTTGVPGVQLATTSAHREVPISLDKLLAARCLHMSRQHSVFTFWQVLVAT